jgi:hypothetical protein
MTAVIGLRRADKPGYGWAAAAPVFLFLLRLALVPILDGHAAFLLFTAPVAAASILGGLRPALLAFAMGALGGSAVRWFEPREIAALHDTSSQLSELLLYTLASGIIVSFGSGICAKQLAADADASTLQFLTQQQQARIAQLDEALQNVRTLSGMLPICAACKQIRDNGGDWHSVEEYVSTHSEAEFSHGLCPTCALTFMKTV